MRIVKNGNSFQISLPKAIVLSKGWSAGDKLKIVINQKGNLEIVREEKNGLGSGGRYV